MKITSYDLIKLALAYKGEYHSIKKAIAQNKQVNVSIPATTEAITILDKEYPDCLLQSEQPPWVLFYKGNLSYLQMDKKVAIVGSRQPNDYATTMTKKVVSHLDRDIVIVSGLAKGIDAIAHQAALTTHHCIAVLGCGIDRVYPYENKALYDKLIEDHLIISEYPLFTPGLKHHFIARNRIIAALSDQVYVMSAKAKSGTKITVDFALALNKEIIVLPYNIDEASGVGCNELIASGAQILTNDADLFIIKKDVVV